MIEALLSGHIETVEEARELGPQRLTERLARGKPVLSSREIDTVLRVLFGGRS